MTMLRLPPASLEEVYDVLDGEFHYQKMMWENPELTDSAGLHRHDSNVEFLVYMRDYIEEALHVATRKPDPEARVFVTHSMRKITAMGVQAMKQNGVLPR